MQNTNAISIPAKAESGSSPTTGEWTDEALNVAIAEACGWKKLRKYQNALGWRQTDWMRGTKGEDAELAYGNDMLPNYVGDLNACHEFESTLGLTRCDEYEEHLREFHGLAILDSPANKKVADLFWWHATARQKCLAFVKTLGLSPRVSAPNEGGVSSK
jgi:hypothetical protein